MHPSPSVQDRVWERFVALGDSFTEGLADADPEHPGEYVGWADRMASALSARNAGLGHPFGYANLAVRGRLIADVVDEQLDRALAMEPDLVLLSAGGNDLLQSRSSGPYVAEQLEQVARRVRGTGADLLLVTAPDVSWVSLVSRVHHRLLEYTAHVWAVAQRTGSRVVDIYTLPCLSDPRMYAPDRIHLSSEGHARVAVQALWTLGLQPARSDWREPLPVLPPLGRRESLISDSEWIALHLRPWLRRQRRGESLGDGRPPKRPELLPWVGPHHQDVASSGL